LQFLRKVRADGRTSTLDIDLLRKGIGNIIERIPEHRHLIAQTLRELLNKLAYTRSCPRYSEPDEALDIWQWEGRAQDRD